jgi:hypothetical protein
MAMLLAVPAAADIELPRPGQVGISLQGGYGFMLDSGPVGSVFDVGSSYAIRLRYRMRYERGIGLSFENHGPEARTKFQFDPAFPESAKADKLSLILSGIEFYQLFNTRTKTVSMLVVGAGLAQYRTELNSGETELSGETSGDGLYVSSGAGVERFFFRTWAFDFSTRYFAAFKDGKINHDLQAAAGLIFYASY